MSSQDKTLQIEIQESDEYAVIIPKGYLNALIGDRIDKACEQLVERGMKYLIINFGQIELINTIGISILVGIIEKVLMRHGLVYFTELGGTNREIFEVLGLQTVAMIFPTDADALAHMRNDREIYRPAIGG
ncbi:MAG: STAS domain-containing protein [Candidatus Sumerlaeia bacterium]